MTVVGELIATIRAFFCRQDFRKMLRA